MKKLISISAFLLILSGSLAIDATARQSLHEEHVQLMHSYWNAFLSGDIDAVAELLSDDFMAYGPGSVDEFNKAEYVEYWKGYWDTQISSMTLTRAGTIPYTIPEGDFAGEWVFDWVTAHTQYNDYPDITVNIPIHLAAFVNDGKISALIGYYDTGSIMSALGFSFTPPSVE